MRREELARDLTIAAISTLVLEQRSITPEFAKQIGIFYKELLEELPDTTPKKTQGSGETPESAGDPHVARRPNTA